MFTGLVEQVGSLQRLARVAGGWRLNVTCQPWSEPLVLGESVAVQGACLTVVEITAAGFAADLLDETLSRTALGGLTQGARLNLERALRVGDRLGGHWVSGHIDETGQIVALERQGRDILVRVACTAQLTRLMVPKGSVALDGISLTLAGLEQDSFTVAIIPHTWAETSLSERNVGDRVNLEADLIGKHVARLVLEMVPGGAGGRVDEALLRQAGFME